MELEPRLIVRFVRAVARHAHVAGGDTLYRTVLVEQDFGRGKARENLNPQGFGLFGQPAAQIAEATGVIAVIAEQRRHHQMRQRVFLLRTEHPMEIVGDGRLPHRTAVGLPRRQQLIERLGIDDGTRQDVRADFRPLFKHADAGVGRDLFETDRRGEAGGAAADDHQIIGHRFAFAHGLPPGCGCGSSRPANDWSGNGLATD